MSIQFATSAHLYEVRETLRESLLSTVYLAHRLDKDFKIPVVIKLFKQKKSSWPVLQLESLLRARHSSHLVKVLSFERYQSRLALILEYISAVNLKQLIKNTELNQQEISCICSQTLTGLMELKKSGLAHGDLSLSNILIDTKGQVYLTDYGLANYEKKVIYSTEPFTAPELYEGKTSCFQSDLFSLGILEKVLRGRLISIKGSMEGRHFVRKGDLLLDPEPQNRKEKPFDFSPSALSSLGSKVQQILFIKNCFQKISAPVLPPSGIRGFIEKSFRKQNFKAVPFVSLFFSSFLFFGIKKFFRFFYCFVPSAGILVLLLFTANPFISYGRYIPASSAALPAEVLIRTQQWIHIQMAGFTGYTPINIRVNKPGVYKLKWKKQNSAGFKYIYLNSGQKLVLKDNDFP